jgi:hypothetical protein
MTIFPHQKGKMTKEDILILFLCVSIRLLGYLQSPANERWRRIDYNDFSIDAVISEGYHLWVHYAC